MKKWRLFFVFTALVLPAIILAESPSEKSILVNPDFEADTGAPWYKWGEAGTVTYGATEHAHTGKNSLKMEANGGDGIAMGFLQDFECLPGDKITVSAWMMSPEKSPLTNSRAFVKLEFWGTDAVNPLKTYESEHLTDTFDWKESAVSDEAPEGTVKAKIGLFIWNPRGGHAGDVYFDDAKALRSQPEKH